MLSQNDLRDVYAKWLRRALDTAGEGDGRLTTTALAVRAGVSRGTISAILNRRTDPDPATVEALAKALQVEPPALALAPPAEFGPVPSAKDKTLDAVYLELVQEMMGWTRQAQAWSPVAARGVQLLAVFREAARAEAAAMGAAADAVIDALRRRVAELEQARAAGGGRPPGRAAAGD